MGSPLASISSVLGRLEFVRNSLHFKLPLLLADTTLNDCIVSHFGLHLSGQIVVRVVATELFLLDHVVVALVGVDHVGQISPTVQVVTVYVLGVLLHVSSLLGLHDKLLEAELVLKRHLREFKEHLADSLAESSLDLAGRDIQFNFQLLQLENDVLTCCLGVVVLVPVSDLVVVDGQQPADQADEVQELLTRILGRQCKVGASTGLKSPTQ